MTENNSYKIDHRYNQNNTPMIPRNGQQSVKSYREQIETMLTRWHQLQKAKQPCQPIDFDTIMESDLTRQLHEIEEQEQNNLLEKTLELQLNQLDNQPCRMSDVVDDVAKKQLKEIEILKQSENNEQQRQYDRILQQLKQYEKLQNNSQYKPKTNKNSNHHPTKEFVYIHQQKQILELKLTIIKENKMKTRKILHLLQSFTNEKKIYVIKKTK